MITQLVTPLVWLIVIAALVWFAAHFAPGAIAGRHPFRDDTPSPGNAFHRAASPGWAPLSQVPVQGVGAPPSVVGSRHVADPGPATFDGGAA